MPTESEVKLARYSEVVKEADDFGRVIGVRRLRPSEQTKLAAMTADVTGSDNLKTDDGAEVSISHRLPLIVAASVCEINDNGTLSRIPFPKTRGELDAVYDRLDAEGIAAASKAIVRLNEVTDPSLTKDEAKN